MNSYVVHASVQFTVEAHNEEEAKDIAAHQLSTEGVGDSPIEISDVLLRK